MAYDGDLSPAVMIVVGMLVVESIEQAAHWAVNTVRRMREEIIVMFPNICVKRFLSLSLSLSLSVSVSLFLFLSFFLSLSLSLSLSHSRLLFEWLIFTLALQSFDRKRAPLQKDIHEMEAQLKKISIQVSSAYRQ